MTNKDALKEALDIETAEKDYRIKVYARINFRERTGFLPSEYIEKAIKSLLDNWDELKNATPSPVFSDTQERYVAIKKKTITNLLNFGGDDDK